MTVTAAASDQPCLVSASCDGEGDGANCSICCVTTCDGCSVSALQAAAGPSLQQKLDQLQCQPVITGHITLLIYCGQGSAFVTPKYLYHPVKVSKIKCIQTFFEGRKDLIEMVHGTCSSLRNIIIKVVSDCTGETPHYSCGQ